MLAKDYAGLQPQRLMALSYAIIENLYTPMAEVVHTHKIYKIFGEEVDGIMVLLNAAAADLYNRPYGQVDHYQLTIDQMHTRVSRKIKNTDDYRQRLAQLAGALLTGIYYLKTEDPIYVLSLLKSGAALSETMQQEYAYELQLLAKLQQVLKY
ncbi:hypothetical protein FLA_1466 [Filimonas lacunae]|nr:hypothetical protein FLA_1466 [Filimonas lacunae]